MPAKRPLSPRPAPVPRGPGHGPRARADRLLHYPGTDLAIGLRDADPVARALDDAIRGWQATMLPTHRTCPRRTHVARRRGAFDVTPASAEARLEGLGAAGAACAVIADLAEAYLAHRPDLMALHCGAVRFGDAPLILLAGPHRSGKSTLVARLGAEPDLTVFCDDVLPVTPDGQAIALGIAPRLRLPLPAAASAAFRAHVAATPGPRDDRYAYLAAPSVAAHGDRAGLGALIVLDRRDQGPARLHRMDPDQALHHLLAQNMSDLGCAPQAFARVEQLASGLTCLRLVYADLEDAVALLRRAMGPDALPGDPPFLPPLPEPLHVQATRMSPVPVDLVLRQGAGVELRMLGAGAFLWRAGDPTLWHLNPVGHAVWTLLAIPGDARDLALTLSEVFPDIDPARLTADIALLMAELLAEGFIAAA